MNKKNLKITLLLSSLRVFIFLALIIWSIIAVSNGIKLNGDLVTSKIVTISFCFSIVFVMFLLMNISLIMNYIYGGLNNNNIIISLSILTLNIEMMIWVFRNERPSFKFKKLPKITIFDLTASSVLLALYFVIGYITTFIPTTQFFFIELTFKYIPLFFGAFILTKTSSFILCFTAASLTALLPGVYLAFWQFLFDYWITAFCIFFASFFAPSVKSKNWIVKLSVWFSFVTVPIIIIYFSRVTSGVIFWLNPNKQEQFPQFEWSNTVGYSFIYNSVNTIFDYVMLMICIPVSCESLWVIKERFFTNSEYNN
ncbi:energy-coupled thiamine transporter ThiT [Spiroplasma sp. BIUS-1]|uniref:energy-coupled thiamine transporter ThiT n=1 Tax=Spiroplasma sp. BIUS-1 TaxID=216964 RepID=UPI0013979344|nr:energy-coupled thiamine transporter ThiT [Spiroplasma sp. BIUS-1]QHX36469.1 thiamine transporter [Spiroplasma sp. BIUS-1]